MRPGESTPETDTSRLVTRQRTRKPSVSRKQGPRASGDATRRIDARDRHVSPRHSPEYKEAEREPEAGAPRERGCDQANRRQRPTRLASSLAPVQGGE